MEKRLVIGIFAQAALVAAVAGCGGGGADTTAGAALTKAEFLERGNAICAKGTKDIEEGFERFREEQGLEGGSLSQEQLTEAIEVVVLPVVREELEGVAALGIPKGSEAEIEALHEVDGKALEKAEAEPSSLAREETNPFAEANRLAAKVGLLKCTG